jgi:hypothetical protein
MTIGFFCGNFAVDLVKYSMSLHSGKHTESVHVISELFFVVVRSEIPSRIKIEAVPNPKQIQKLKVKNKNDKSKPKDVVRGFSLVPGWDCTTLKGRTTIVFGT